MYSKTKPQLQKPCADFVRGNHAGISPQSFYMPNEGLTVFYGRGLSRGRNDRLCRSQAGLVIGRARHA